jgi:hypothetical protein
MPPRSLSTTARVLSDHRGGQEHLLLHASGDRPVALGRTPRLRSPGPLHSRTPRSASAGARFANKRHRPEETTLCRVVQEDLESFLAQDEAQRGSGPPQFVKDEFDAYLECVILAHGFLRVRCAECAQERLVAFSCKRRGGGSSPRAGHVAWPRRRRCCWIAPYRRCRSGNGCCRFRSRYGFCSPPIPSSSHRCWASCTGSSGGS